MHIRDDIENIERNEIFNDAICLDIDEEVLKKLDIEKFVNEVIENFKWIIEARLELEVETDSYKEEYINPILYFKVKKNNQILEMDNDEYINWIEDLLDDFTKKHIKCTQ